MFNHKRLITLSIAASMVIPSFSTMTSVLANEPFVELNDQEENIFLETAANSTVISLKKEDFTTPNPNYFISQTGSNRDLTYELKSGNYKLDEDVEVSFTISIPKGNTVTLDLNGKTLTNKTTYQVFQVVGSCALKSETSKGTINHEDSTAVGINSHAFKVTGKLSISNVEINTKWTGDIFEVTGAGNELTIENSSIKGDRTGISIPYFYGNTGPTINLINVNLKTEGPGVWQAYPSTITLENCEVESPGLSSKIGTLNIFNSVIKKYSEINSSEPTTDQVGVELIPNKKGPFTANIVNSVISGDRALLIIDQDESDAGQLENIKIDILNTTLAGKKYNLGYVGNIPFTLNNVLLGDNKENRPEKLKFVEDPQSYGGLNLEKDTTPSNTVPYTINTSNQTSKMELNEKPETLPNSSLLTKKAQSQVEEALTNQAKTQGTNSKKSISVYSWDGSTLTSSQAMSTPLNYTYQVVLANPQYTFKENNNTYVYQTNITVTLSVKSIIGLVLPLLSSSTVIPQSSEMIEELENGSTEDNTSDSSSKVIYVALEDVLKNPTNISSGLSSQTIQKVFEGLKETLDLAQLSEFEKIDLNQAFEIKDIGEVIEINGSEKQVVSNTPTGGGHSSKPKPKPQEPTEEPTTPVGTPTSIYRLYNRLTGEHLYTTNKAERDSLLTSDTWKDEGQGWTAPSVSDFPVYRLLNPNTGDHHYTTDKNEFETLPSYGWIAEGIAFFSADKDKEENVILHRVYNPNAQGAGSHHYTTDKNERDSLISQGWIDEGTAWAGLPTE